jgi:hypothetical protein
VTALAMLLTGISNQVIIDFLVLRIDIKQELKNLIYPYR